MKGLLRKDLYMIWRYGRLLLLISALFLVLGAISGGNTFFILYPVLFGGVLPVNLISYEERDGWNALCDTMPVSRKTVVNERYLMTLLCFLALYLITLGIHAPLLLPKGRAEVLGRLACLLPGVGLAAPALMIPVTLKWGMEKGRLVYFAIIGIATAVMSQIDGTWITQQRAEIAGPGMWTILPIAAALFVLSWRISLRVYESREL